MKPEVPATLQTLAGTLLGELAPQLGSDYARKTAGTIAGLLAAASEEWDRAAEWRVEENRAIRRLFSDAAPHMRSDGLRRRLELAARGRDYTLRISALDANNARLRALLIELHAHVETVRSPQAEQIEEQIWEELRAGVERRAIAFWPL